MYVRKSDWTKVSYQPIDHKLVEVTFEGEPPIVMTWSEFWQTVTIPK